MLDTRARPLAPLAPLLNLRSSGSSGMLLPADHATEAPPVSTRPLVQLQPRPLSIVSPTSSLASPSSRESLPTTPSRSRQRGVPPSATQAGIAATGSSGTRPRSMKKCNVPLCESYARSRGLCKAHGGGKRCKRPGCDLSDQGGGLCIRHGGGKRCQVDGCTKSAQSKRYCKAHGGGARCRVDGCEKSSQGGGLCRTHGGGPRRKKQVNAMGELVASPGSKGSTKQHAVAPNIIPPSQETAQKVPLQPFHAWMRGNSKMDDMNAGSAQERIECEKGTGALTFKIRAIEPKQQDKPRAVATSTVSEKATAPVGLDRQPVPCPAERVNTREKSPSGVRRMREEQSEATNMSRTSEHQNSAKSCRVVGCDNSIPSEKELCEEHRTHLFVAASLLGMQTSSN